MGEQRDVAPDLAARAGRDPERGGELREPVAVGVPGDVGHRQLEPGGQPIGHGEALRPEGRQGARRASELQHERVVEGGSQASPRPVERVGPARRLEAERDWCCLLQPGAAGHRGVAVTPRVGRGGADAPRQVVDRARNRRPELQHQAGIQDVLAGRTPVDEARRLRVGFRHPRGQMPHHRNNGVARLRRLGRELVRVVQLGAGRRLNRRHAACGHHAGVRLGRGQRHLDIQHRLKLGAPGEARRGVRVAQQPRLQARAVHHA